MTPDLSPLEKWAALYAERRRAAEPGWAGADSYRLKQGRIAEALSEHAIPPAATFLELGCGAGNITLWMAERGFAAFGVDVVPEAVRWAEDNAARLTLPAQFHVANLARLDMFQDGVFDVIFDGDCFHMITGAEREACFREVYRVLRPGGLLVAGGNVRDETVPPAIGGHIVTPDGLEYVLRSEAELCQELRRAGFAILCVKRYAKRGGHRFVKESLAVHATR